MQRTDDNQNTQENGAAPPEQSSEPSRRGAVVGEDKRAKDKNIAAGETASSTESSDSDDNDGPDEILIPEPGMEYGDTITVESL